MSETIMQKAVEARDRAIELSKDIRVRAVAALAVAATLGVSLASNEKTSKVGTAEATAQAEGINCDITGFDDLSTNADNYNTEAYLPEAEDGIDDKEEAPEYIKSLFGGEDGPFGKTTDQVSLAAINAVITVPARDGKAINTNYSFTKNFRTKLNAYNAEGGEQLAKDDCKLTAETLIETGEYTEDWGGQNVIKLTAVRNKDNKIVGMRPTKYVSGEDLSGVEFAHRATSKNTDGFNEVLVTEEGDMYVKGVDIEPTAGKDQDKDKGGAKNKNRDDEGRDNTGNAGGSGTREAADNDSRRGSSGGGTGTSNGRQKTGKNGGGGQGTGKGKGGGGSGGQNGGCGGGGGCGSTPTTGGGNGGPAPTPTPEPTPTPTPEQRPEPTPEPTPPTQTTTPPTETTPPTTTTPPTEEPKGPEPPADCANNPYDPRC